MSEPTEPTQPTPPATPGETPTVPPTVAGGAASPPPPPTTTWSTAAPADAPSGPYASPAPATPTIGRNLAIGIAVGALVIGGLLGALISQVVDDRGSNDRFGSSDGRNGRMGQMYGDQGQGRGQMPMGPRGVDPDGDDWTGGGQNGRTPGGSTPTTPTTPSTPSTTPAVAGT